MIFRNVITIFSAVVFLVIANSQVAYTQTYLEQLDYHCTRDCDSHFTGANCWKKTFGHFINHMVQATVQFKNGAVETTKCPSSTNCFDAVKLTEIFTQTWEKFRAEEEYLKIANDENLKIYSELIDQLTNLTLTRVIANLTAPMTNGIQVNKCPSPCASDALVVWKSLFGTFIGLTLVTVLFVTAASTFAKVQYKKYEKLKLAKSVAHLQS